MGEIINEFEEFCGNLAISGDSPTTETIKQYFDRYAEALQLQQTGVMAHFSDENIWKRAFKYEQEESVNAFSDANAFRDGAKWLRDCLLKNEP